jgi:hypothetical protein
MSVGPRIVFTRFVTGETPKLRPWREHYRRVVGADPHVADPHVDGVVETAVVWNLVSANNRALARSAGVHPNFEDAVAGARAAVSAGSMLDVVLVSEQRRGVFGWYLALVGDPVMTCARWYVTERDRRHAIDLALTSLAIATLHPGSRLMDPALMGGTRDSHER